MSTSSWSTTNTLTTKSNYVPSSEEALLSASDKATSNSFGYCIAIDSTGTRVIIGAYTATVSSLGSAGKAYVFLRTGNSWSQEAILSGTNKVSNGMFGISVGIDSTGTRVIVGAHQEAPGGYTQGGNAYIFLRTGTSWTQEKILQASDMGNTFERFGGAVAVSSDASRAVVGAKNGDAASFSDVGKIYVYLRSGTTWTQETLINCPGGSSSWLFGYAVAMDSTGTRIVASALNGTYSGTGGSGVAFIFKRVTATWSLEATLGSDAPANRFYFGYSVSMDLNADRVSISEPESAPSGLTDAGKVHIFLRTNTTWARETTLTANDKVITDLFGYGCSISSAGDRIIIGSYNADVSGVSNCGKAYIFTRSGVAWSQSAICLVSSYAQDDKCITTAISGDGTRAAYGSTGKDIGGITNCGAVGVFA